MPGEYERLERKYDRLEPQNQGVHQPERVYGVKSKASGGAGVLGDDQVVIVGIGIGDATAARRHPLQPAFIERLEKHQKRARPRHVLR